MLEEFPIFITPFNTDRTIRVYQPPNHYKSNENYPVLYMHDGKNVFRDEVAIGGTSLGLESYLDAIGIKLIVVGIDADLSREERINEYCPWVNGEFSKMIIGDSSDLGGKGEAYVEFIVNELKPLVDRKYRTLPDKTYMGGVSIGGLISAFAACRYPNVFTRVAGVSTAFYRNQEKIEKLLGESDLSAIERFYLDCGTKEAGEEDTINHAFVNSNEAVYQILRDKVSNTKFKIIPDAKHNYENFRKRVPEIFSFMFSDL